ncbi:MAG: ABC transporter permease [Phycisphaeraceae bacterium]
MSRAEHATGSVIVWHGQMKRRRALLLRGGLYVGVGLLWLVLFLALPALLLVVIAMIQRGPYGTFVWELTTENLTRTMGWGMFGWSADTLRILGRTITVASVTTAVNLVLSFPLAFFIASRPRRSRMAWLALIIVPCCTNMVVRAYAWMLVLSPQFPPSRAAQALGWIDDGAGLYPGPLAVYLGMITTLLPFTVLPIYTNVERLDWSLVEAASDLYASRWRVFRHAILAQIRPGLVAAIVLTFIPAMGMFVIPKLLGGSKYMLVGDLIQQQFGESRDYPYGAALSLVLMAMTLLGLWLSRRYFRKSSESRGGEAAL